MKFIQNSTSLTSLVQDTSRADIGIIGGAGHVGLPLGLAFAGSGLRVLLYDINVQALNKIQQGIMPFMERGAEPMLKTALSTEKLKVSSSKNDLTAVPYLILTIGTPIDRFLNPTRIEILQAIEELLPVLSDDQLIILRSTVYPGTTEWLDGFFRSKGRSTGIAFCPERITEGNAIEELQMLPQIVSGTSTLAEEKASHVFSYIAPKIVHLKPMEAEFAKLFCNAYRYIQFATANQFYLMALAANVDYYKILSGMKEDYPRMADMPKAGFAAGPCLLKDTMQLAAFSNNEFSLGNSAMLINEGLPLQIVARLETKYDLCNLTVGLLGMAFKANSDDPRSSLSYKLKKVFSFKAKRVLTTDPYVGNDPDLLPIDKVLNESDILVLCAPHEVYKEIRLRNEKQKIVDIWNFFGQGGEV